MGGGSSNSSACAGCGRCVCVWGGGGMHEYNVNHFHHRTAPNGSGPTAHGTMPKLNIRICATSDIGAAERVCERGCVRNEWRVDGQQLQHRMRCTPLRIAPTLSTVTTGHCRGHDCRVVFSSTCHAGPLATSTGYAGPLTISTCPAWPH
jgi:hypothetical protein